MTSVFLRLEVRGNEFRIQKSGSKKSEVMKLEVQMNFRGFHKGKIFLAIKGIPKIGECQLLAFFIVVCWDQMIENNLKRCLLIYCVH